MKEHRALGIVVHPQAGNLLPADLQVVFPAKPGLDAHLFERLDDRVREEPVDVAGFEFRAFQVQRFSSVIIRGSPLSSLGARTSELSPLTSTHARTPYIKPIQMRTVRAYNCKRSLFLKKRR